MFSYLKSISKIKKDHEYCKNGLAVFIIMEEKVIIIKFFERKEYSTFIDMIKSVYRDDVCLYEKCNLNLTLEGKEQSILSSKLEESGFYQEKNELDVDTKNILWESNIEDSKLEPVEYEESEGSDGEGEEEEEEETNEVQESIVISSISTKEQKIKMKRQSLKEEKPKKKSKTSNEEEEKENEENDNDIELKKEVDQENSDDNSVEEQEEDLESAKVIGEEDIPQEIEVQNPRKDKLKKKSVDKEENTINSEGKKQDFEFKEEDLSEQQEIIKSKKISTKRTVVNLNFSKKPIASKVDFEVSILV